MVWVIFMRKVEYYFLVSVNIGNEFLYFCCYEDIILFGVLYDIIGNWDFFLLLVFLIRE